LHAPLVVKLFPSLCDNVFRTSIVVFVLYGMNISFHIVLGSVLITCTERLLKRRPQTVERGLSSVAAINISRSVVSTGLGLQNGDCSRFSNYRRPVCSTLSLVT